jgi:SAM-dependent methyltransferase
MGHFKFSQFRKWLAPPHPTWQSKKSRNRVFQFLNNEKIRSPHGLRLNIGSGSRRLDTETLNLDLLAGEELDIQGDLLHLPIKNEIVEAAVCTGVLEHVSDPHKAVEEIYRALKFGGRVFLEIPFMQTVHASPTDFYRWTPDGIRQLMRTFDVIEFHVVAGPASAFAWQFQETMAMLFSFNSSVLYKIGLRIFGWLAVPLSWLDILLERNPMAWHAASGYALTAVKHQHPNGKE